VITMHAKEFLGLSDMKLVQMLTATDRRPSLLVLCDEDEREAVVTALITWCVAPAHVCQLPGSLELPTGHRGTIILADVSGLSLWQQINLQQWLDDGRGDTQIVSVTSEPLWPLVEQGRFLEGLYYRLNVVTVEAKRSQRRSREKTRG
jgi:sigma-54-interacting transcriptional regulator